jgi:2-polyprenyl-3-methyl-5-hydroxy-6-metoxy-1,4-benzoquinol methylase
MLDFWDNRYRENAYAYGTQPNQFFKAMLDRLTPGRLLLPAEGEGRNAVYAARNGWQVTAVDFSAEACRKAQELAQSYGVSLTYEVEALEDFSPKEADFDLIGLVFTHLPPGVRQLLHQRVAGWVKKIGLCRARSL